MSNYYLMAQLPALDQVEGAAPLPITEERYLELCSRFLSKKAAAAVKSLTLLPDRRESATGWALIDAWNDGERQLRMALAGLRAKRMKKTTKADKKDIKKKKNNVKQKTKSKTNDGYFKEVRKE